MMTVLVVVVVVIAAVLLYSAFSATSATANFNIPTSGGGTAWEDDTEWGRVSPAAELNAESKLEVNDTPRKPVKKRVAKKHSAAKKTTPKKRQSK
jgi:hypothetical protein